MTSPESMLPISISCLGPEGSFSHEFASSHFSEAECRCVDGDFAAVLAEVSSGACRDAVLPFLNSNGVHVAPAQAALGALAGKIWVTGCFPHDVIHHLVVPDGFVSLSRIVSKEQVFPQCSDWLGKWSGQLEHIFAPSTSAGLRDLLQSPLEVRKSTAAICNTRAHEIYGGTIRHEGIQNRGNITLFLIVSSEPPPLDLDEVLVCLTCPTEECYKHAIDEFKAHGYKLMFTSLKGVFTPTVPCFLQFQQPTQRDVLEELLSRPHRHFIGAFGGKASISSCVTNLFDDSLDL
jgi:prephenate dehydratase